MRMNLTAAHLILNYGEAIASGDKFIKEQQGQILFSLRKTGLMDGALKVTLQPVSTNIAATGPPLNFGLFHLESVTGSLPFTLKPGIHNGDTVVFNLIVDNGEYAWPQEVVRIYSPTATPVVSNPGDDMSLWSTSTDWGLTNEDYFSSPMSTTDSPYSNYFPNNFTDITMKYPVDVTGATAAALTFWAKWDIEEDQDYAQVLLSVNGAAYIPLCGKYSEPGTYSQDFEAPLYDGTQSYWVKEEIDLGEYLAPGSDSTHFNISFRLVTDPSVQADGFYFDDLALTVLSGDVTATTAAGPVGFDVISRPNPASDAIVLELQDGQVWNQEAEWQVFNALGVEVFRQKATGRSLVLDTINWNEGIYFYQISGDKITRKGGRFIIAH
ncbi:MAG: T9SS type A sorting domain-containing protein [Saprospiraceae bacterium]|nr:MAG: T9SS type A sorting domain-containing protein [Saprospiraceae bacterium]